MAMCVPIAMMVVMVVTVSVHRSPLRVTGLRRGTSPYNTGSLLLIGRLVL